jgi:glycine cleavage system regulatory protein
MTEFFAATGDSVAYIVQLSDSWQSLTLIGDTLSSKSEKAGQRVNINVH